MRRCLLALIVIASVSCKSRSDHPPQAKLIAAETAPAALPAAADQLQDISPSLDSVRALFNAHKGEARFLTLLSPT